MKTILITGAARRIGAHMAEHLHQLGHRILIHYHQSQHEAIALYQQFNQIRPKSADLVQANLNQADAASLIFQALQKLGAELDVIIHNASIFTPNDQDWDAFFQIHVKTPYQLNHLCYPMLKQRQGHIINITDIHATKAKSGYSAYLQSKAALHMQTQTLALEFAPDIKVNEIAPGKILAPEHLLSHHEADILAQIPLQRRGNPLDIAKTAAFLIESNYITGQTIQVDGGASLTR